jgi:hypothetical protein
VEIAGSNPAGGTNIAPVIRAAAAQGALALPFPAMSPLDYLGVHIPTIVEDNVSIRCDGCLEVIAGTPWRMNILDIVAPETAVSWALRPPLNPGPFEFHGDGAHVRMWMRARGYLFCRKGEVREIMRPIPIPGPDEASPRYGLCDGIHRDDHELVPA